MDEKIRLYSQKAITLSAFIGGPLAAGILIRRNSLNLKREKEGRMALAISIAFTILLSAGLISIPEDILDKIPSALIPGLYIGIIYLIVNKIHGPILIRHKEEEGLFYSNWKAAGIGAIALIIMCAIFVLSHLLIFGTI